METSVWSWAKDTGLSNDVLCLEGAAERWGRQGWGCRSFMFAREEGGGENRAVHVLSPKRKTNPIARSQLPPMPCSSLYATTVLGMTEEGRRGARAHEPVVKGTRESRATTSMRHSKVQVGQRNKDWLRLGLLSATHVCGLFGTRPEESGRIKWQYGHSRGIPLTARPSTEDHEARENMTQESAPILDNSVGAAA